MRALSLREARLGDLEVREGRVGDADVVATLTTMGTAAAASATERLVHQLPSLAHVVVVGIAGGIGPSVEVGDLVVPETVIDAATGREYRPAPLGGGPPSRAVVPRGKLWTSDEFVVDQEAVAGLVERGVVAVDMETAAVAAVCEARKLPWSVFRAISDRAEDYTDAWVLDLAHPDGSPNVRAITRLLTTRPWYAPRLARLGRDATVAARKAALAAAEALRRGALDARD